MSDLFGAKIVDSSVEKGADISACGLYRYRLWRTWNHDTAPLPFIMLNPSTADANLDDPTIRRCMGFARREKSGGIVVVNLFAYRATKPDDLPYGADAKGHGNAAVLRELAESAGASNQRVVCAWGGNGDRTGKAWTVAVVGLFQGYRVSLVCLGKTDGGYPRHPLYVPGNQPLEPYP